MNRTEKKSLMTLMMESNIQKVYDDDPYTLDFTLDSQNIHEKRLKVTNFRNGSPIVLTQQVAAFFKIILMAAAKAPCDRVLLSVTYEFIKVYLERMPNDIC